MAAITCWSLSDDTNVMARPFVPKRPARLSSITQHQIPRISCQYSPHAVKVAVRIRRAVVVDHDVDTLHIDTTTEDICRHENTLLKCIEGGVACDTVRVISASRRQYKRGRMTYRSSCARPEWIAILGKLHDTSNLSSSIAQVIDLTKIMTYCDCLSYCPRLA